MGIERMHKNTRIRFVQYDIQTDGREYCILIPPHTEQLWTSGYGNKHWGVNIYGNRQGLEALMYSAYVLGAHSQNRIIYLPIRHNEKPEFFRKKDVFPGEPDTILQDYDLVLTTHHALLNRSSWKKIKQTMRYQRAKEYALHYDRAETKESFQKTCTEWKRKNGCDTKHSLLETVQKQTLFYVFDSIQYQQLYLVLQEFLEKDLEEQSAKDKEFLPATAVGLYGGAPYYRKKKIMQNHPWIHFYDMELEDHAEDNNKK